MNNVEFMFWLQGCLEIVHDNKITAAQYEIIKKNLSQVKFTNGESKNTFFSWLEGVFDMIDQAPTVEQFQLIKKKLKEAIDNVEQLNVKNPSNNKPNHHAPPLLARC